MQENMRAIVRGRTVIIIAHRLAALRPCTRIVGMHRGEIVEAGNARGIARADGWALRPSLGSAVRPGEGDGMNERAIPPPKPSPSPPSSGPPPLAVTGRDREFLPAALEILETPPPPLPIALIADDLRLCSHRAHLVLPRAARCPRGCVG